jgi:hypothetical protein
LAHAKLKGATVLGLDKIPKENGTLAGINRTINRIEKLVL